MVRKNQFLLNAVSEIHVSYKPKFKASERPKVTNSKDVYALLIKSWDTDLIEYVEEFKILLLNRACKVLGVFSVSKGGIAGTYADPKVIFAAALKCGASSIILAHNHPSGNLTPSEADKQLTKKLIAAGKLLDIEVPDHLILTVDGYASLGDQGLLV